MLILVLKLLLAHSIGDFLLQPYKWVKDKEAKKIKSKYLYAHIGVHLVTLLVVLQFAPKYWLGILIIILSHFAIDLAKLHFTNKKNKRIAFFLDQFLHIIVLIVVSDAYTDYTFDFLAIYNPKNMLLGITLISLTRMSSIVIGVLISRWTPEDNESSLDKAGSYIGMLERLFIFGFIILNQWSGIGFLLAAKSMFRFGDLTNANDRKLTEYVLIGTFISFGLAILIGKGYLYFLAQL